MCLCVCVAVTCYCQNEKKKQINKVRQPIHRTGKNDIQEKSNYGKHMKHIWMSSFAMIK